MSEHDPDDATDSSTYLLPQTNPNPKTKSFSFAQHQRLHHRLTSKRIAIILFFSGYVLAILFFQHYSARDPTSFFFNKSLGYSARYSAVRTVQAESFIERVNNGSLIPSSQRALKPRLCIAIPTVARRGSTQYVRAAIGSLLEDLSDIERAQLHVILFIAHVDPNTHPISNERWTQTLPDQVISYRKGRLGIPLKEVQSWEVSGAYIPKGLYDYAVALDACRGTDAPLIGVFEGDVLAARGWMSRALRAAERIRLGASETASGNWLYLRLFYTETYLGWNREFWRYYLGYSLGLFISLVGILFVLRRRSTSLAPLLTSPTIAFVSSVALPMTIILFFLAGRMTVLPLNPGVMQMDDYGCCSQATVFPAVHAPWLVAQLRTNWRAASAASTGSIESVTGTEIGERKGYVPYVDMLLEHLAASAHLERYATVPSLVQHVGRSSTKGDPIADMRAQRIWSFGFEDLPEDEGVRGMGWTEDI